MRLRVIGIAFSGSEIRELSVPRAQSRDFGIEKRAYNKQSGSKNHHKVTTIHVSKLVIVLLHNIVYNIIKTLYRAYWHNMHCLSLFHCKSSKKSFYTVSLY